MCRTRRQEASQLFPGCPRRRGDPPRERRGEALDFQRALDHAGAVLGALVAAGLLLLPGVSLRNILLRAAVPAALAVPIIPAAGEQFSLS